MRSFLYQQTHTYFCQTPGGIEPLAAGELEALGCGNIRKGYRGLYFSATPETLYAVNYQARLITRVLAPLSSFHCRNRDDLYRAARSIDWGACFSVNNTFGIFANVSGNANLHHSKFAALCLKDGVADYFRDRFGKRPDVDKREPDVWLNLHIEKNRGTISLDTSGGSLHRRGYRREPVETSMQEIVAAAMLTLSEWDGQKPVYDPMCGSGTLLCEAAMLACGTPAGFLRRDFGFRFLPDFNRQVWHNVKSEADVRIAELPEGLIAGSDIERHAVKASGINCRRLPHGQRISLSRNDFRDLPGLENRVILCNPPYGIRLQETGDLKLFYKSLGDFLKKRCQGSQAFIYFGNREMLKCVGLRPSWKKPLRNAGLDGRLVKYEIY
ncbi:MAG: class I SAM-dependent RNA methyltransferase [Deltaproteobacteria bacterium]|nr:class I SAM-dependent RNA methyltransferase [Deltaproteobacteria bacterium]